MRYILLFLMMGFISNTVYAADQCMTWIDKDYPVRLEACSYDKGESGYVKITHTGTKAAKICWVVIKQSGSEDSACNSNFRPNSNSRSSCWSCGKKVGGVRAVELRKYQILE